MNSISKLIETLEKSPKSKKIEKLIKLSTKGFKKKNQ